MSFRLQSLSQFEGDAVLGYAPTQSAMLNRSRILVATTKAIDFHLLTISKSINQGKTSPIKQTSYVTMQFFGNHTTDGKQMLLPLPTTTTLSRVGTGAVSPNTISTGSSSSKATSPIVSPTNVPLKRTYNGTPIMNSPPIIDTTTVTMNKRQKLDLHHHTTPTPLIMRQAFEESIRRRRAIDILLLGNKASAPSAAPVAAPASVAPNCPPTSSSMSATAEAILKAHNLMMERQRVLSTLLMARSNNISGSLVTNIPTTNQASIVDTMTTPTSCTSAAAAAAASEPLSSNVLYNIGDDRCLSQFQCLARKQIELFEATQDDVDVGARGRNIPIKLGQVGIRCKHCVQHVNPMSRKRAAVYFPTKLDRVYQTAINMATLHLCQSCEHVPTAVRNELIRLKDQKSTSGGGKRFVAIGIKKQNVVEVEGGLRFASTNTNDATNNDNQSSLPQASTPQEESEEQKVNQ